MNKLLDKIIFPFLLVLTAFGFILSIVNFVFGLVIKPFTLLKWPLNRLIRKVKNKFKRNTTEDYYGK